MNTPMLQPRDGPTPQEDLWGKVTSFDGTKFYAWTEQQAVSDRANITAASWSGGTATITAVNSYATGQIVTVTGMTPSGYDGTYSIASASGTNFTYTVSDPGGAGSAFGTVTVSKFINKPAGRSGSETLDPAYEPNGNALTINAVYRLVKTHYDGLLDWLYAALPIGAGDDVGITSINGETGPAVDLVSTDGSVIITEPNPNEIDFSVPTPYVIGTGNLVDTAATLSGSGTFSPIVYGGVLVDSASLLSGVGTYTPPTFTGTGSLVTTAATIAGLGSYTSPDSFVAKMTAPVMQASSGRWVYVWVEQTINHATGDYQDLAGGRSGDTTIGPFMRERNNVLTCTPVFSMARQRGNFSGQRLYDFEHCCDIGIASGSGTLIAGVDTLSGVGTFFAAGIASGIGDLVAGIDTLSGVGVFGAASVTGTGELLAEVDLLAGVGTFGAESVTGTGNLVAGIDTLSGVGSFYTDTHYTGEGGISLGGIYKTITDLPTQGGISLGGNYS